MSDSPPGVTISFTEASGFQALGNFLQSICTPYPIAVVRAIGSTAPGQNVRVPEPLMGDFIIMSSLMMQRLETNETSYADNIVVGSISGNILTVTEITRGALAVGNLLIDTSYPTMNITSNTVILSQLSGTPGGIGTYQVSVSQTLSSEILYAGVRFDMAGTEWTVQLDVHGPNSMQNARTIDTLFRSEVCVDYFLNAGVAMAPLYSDEAKQIPFPNAEQEMEYRWVMELHMQINAIVTTPQQFADQVQVTTIEAAVNYTG
jgi:hypothetical protein